VRFFIVAILAMGAIRFVLTLLDLPNSTVRFASMTAVMVVGAIYLALTTKTEVERLKAAFLLVLPYMVVEVLALGFTWISGRPTIFHTADYSFGTTIGIHTVGHLVGGLTWEPLMVFALMEVVWAISFVASQGIARIRKRSPEH
jgi:hypothetical protein